MSGKTTEEILDLYRQAVERRTLEELKRQYGRAPAPAAESRAQSLEEIFQESVERAERERERFSRPIVERPVLRLVPDTGRDLCKTEEQS